MRTSPVIMMDGVAKRFGDTVALDGFDLEVSRGEVHGFLGPNGAGKSTAIRILLGVLRADGGHARLLGQDPWRDPVDLHRRIAYVPGEVALWPNLSGGEAIDLLGELRGGLDRARRDEMLERFELDPTRRFDTYSKGNRQKVALVAALAANVELYLLDEPTSGLDPLKEHEFRDCVRELVTERGATVLLSSHILAEVEALGDRVTIIRDGRNVSSGSLAQLRQLMRQSITSITVTTTAAIDGQLAGLPGLHKLELDHAGTTARIEVETQHLSGVMELVGPLGVQSLVSSPPTLEELFVGQYAHHDPAYGG